MMRQVTVVIGTIGMLWAVTAQATPRKRLAEQLYKEGYQKGRSGDYRGAILRFKQALAQDPTHYMARFNMGGAYEALGEKDNAIAQYLWAARLKPGLIEAHTQAGTLLLLHKRQYNNAIEQFRQVLLAKSPTVAGHFTVTHSISQTLQNLAVSYAQKRWYGVAQGIARSYLAHPNVEHQRRRVLERMVQMTERDLRAAMTSAHGPALNRLRALLYGGQPAAARLGYRQFLAQHGRTLSVKEQWDLYSGLAMSNAMLKDNSKAELYFRRAAQVAQALPYRMLIESTFNLACALSLQNKVAGALRAVEEVLWLSRITRYDRSYDHRHARKLSSDKTLSAVRRDPRFAVLLTRYR